MAGRITRTYEKFRIDWDGGPAAGGASWSGYETAEEAQGVIDRGHRSGAVARETFRVTFDADEAGLYRPGIADEAAGDDPEPVSAGAGRPGDRPAGASGWEAAR